MEFGKRIKAIRIAEGFSQKDMAQLIDIPIGTLKNYEQDRNALTFETVSKIASHERFKKYAYWLTTGETLPESGLISPDFSILLECGVINANIDEPKRA